MVVTLVSVDALKSDILDLMDVYTHLAVGTGTTPPVGADTTLETEVDRNALTSNIKNVALGTYLFATTFSVSEANGNTLSEHGIFDAASSGDMWLRNLISPVIVKTADIEAVIYSQVTVIVTNT